MKKRIVSVLLLGAFLSGFALSPSSAENVAPGLSARRAAFLNALRDITA